VIFKIKDDVLTFSLRSKVTPIDHIARHYGWGGHQHASGGARVALRTWADPQTQMQQIIHDISQMLISS
jgi:nanoRNase/pAp phosphatase (c-di-AMP/oligoRNAs hydrolase)